MDVHGGEVGGGGSVAGVVALAIDTQAAFTSVESLSIEDGAAARLAPVGSVIDGGFEIEGSRTKIGEGVLLAAVDEEGFV